MNIFYRSLIASYLLFGIIISSKEEVNEDSYRIIDMYYQNLSYNHLNKDTIPQFSKRLIDSSIKNNDSLKTVLKGVIESKNFGKKNLLPKIF